MESPIKMLGRRGRDIVTGFEGVIESVTFDLYGCVQLILKPPVDKKKPGEIPDGRWFDAKRIKVVGGRVMEAPSFDEAFEPVGGIDHSAVRRG